MTEDEDDDDTRISETHETHGTQETNGVGAHDDPPVALLRAQSHRAEAFEVELRAMAKRTKISEKVVQKFVAHWMEPLWWGERGPQVRDFESFCRRGEKYPDTGYRLAFLKLGPKTRELVAAWLADRGVRVSATYAGPPRCTTCGQVIRASKSHRVHA